MGKICFMTFLTALMFCCCGCCNKEKKIEEYASFYYRSSGAPWECIYECFIDFEKKQLKTVYAKDLESFKKGEYRTKTVELTVSQIWVLQEALNDANVKNWKKKYRPEHPVCDGTFWRGKYKMANGLEGYSAGDNAWPDGFFNIESAINHTGSEFVK